MCSMKVFIVVAPLCVFSNISLISLDLKLAKLMFVKEVNVGT